MAEALSASELAKVTGECQDLLRKFLALDRDSRIDVLQALQHPWFALGADALGQELVTALDVHSKCTTSSAHGSSFEVAYFGD